MEHKYTVLFGIAFGTAMTFVWSAVFCNILGVGGIGVGVCFGIAFACVGCLLGCSIDKKSMEDEGE